MNQMSDEMISSRIISRTQQVQLALSPWIRRLLHDPTGVANDSTRWQSMAVSTGHTLSLLNRVQRQPERTVVWQPDKISVTPMMVDRFSEDVAQRYHYSSIAIKNTPPSDEARPEIQSGVLPLAGQSASPPQTDHIQRLSSQSRSTPPRSPARPEASMVKQAPQLPTPKPHFMAKKRQDIRPSWLRDKPQPPKPAKSQSSTDIALQKTPARGQPAKVKPDPKNLRLFSRVEYLSDMGKMTSPPEFDKDAFTQFEDQSTRSKNVQRTETVPASNQEAQAVPPPIDIKPQVPKKPDSTLPAIPQTSSPKSKAAQVSQPFVPPPFTPTEPHQPDETFDHIEPDETETQTPDAADFTESLPAPKSLDTPQPDTHPTEKSASLKPLTHKNTDTLSPSSVAVKPQVPKKATPSLPAKQQTTSLKSESVQSSQQFVPPPFAPTESRQPKVTIDHIKPSETETQTPDAANVSEPSPAPKSLDAPQTKSSENLGQTLILRAVRRHQMTLSQPHPPQSATKQTAPARGITPQQARTRLIKQGWRFKQKKTDTPANSEQINKTVVQLEQQSETGRPLPEGPRTQVENLLGADFGRVRVQRASLAPLNVEAAMKGSDIYFEAGQDQFDTPQSLALLGHELTHVKQQNLALTKPLSQTTVLPQSHAEQNVFEAESDEKEATNIEYQILRAERRRSGQSEPLVQRSRISHKSKNSEGPSGLTIPQPQVAAIGVSSSIAEWLTSADQAEHQPLVTPAPKQQILRQAEAPAVDAAEPGAAESEAGAGETASAQPDLNQLARQILPLVKRMLKIDNERRPRSSDFGYR